MVTSRTGTASHKRFRREVLRLAQAAGVTHCPNCGALLDYDRGRLPSSAEPDHIRAWSAGGTNDPANGRVLCRLCNQRRGNGKGKRLPMDQGTPKTITNLVAWFGWGSPPRPSPPPRPLGLAIHTHGVFHTPGRIGWLQLAVTSRLSQW